MSVSAKSGTNSELTYAGKDSVTFGFKAFAIAFDGRWRITGVAPSAALAFEAGSESVILSRSTDRSNRQFFRIYSMPYRTTASGSSRYALIAFDQDGQESTRDPDGSGDRFGLRLIEDFPDDAVTDVFLLSHGWMDDVPAAIDQYDRWISAMDSREDDRAQVVQLRPIAIEVVRRIDAPFEIKRSINGKSAGERLQVRQTLSRPLVDDLHV